MWYMLGTRARRVRAHSLLGARKRCRGDLAMVVHRCLLGVAFWVPRLAVNLASFVSQSPQVSVFSHMSSLRSQPGAPNQEPYGYRPKNWLVATPQSL